MIRATLLILCAAGMLAASASGPANADKGRPSSAHVAISLGGGSTVEGKKSGGLKLAGRAGRKSKGGMNDFRHKLPKSIEAPLDIKIGVRDGAGN